MLEILFLFMLVEMVDLVSHLLDEGRYSDDQAFGFVGWNAMSNSFLLSCVQLLHLYCFPIGKTTIPSMQISSL